MTTRTLSFVFCLIAALCIGCHQLQAQAYEKELDSLGVSISKSIQEAGLKKATVLDFTDLQGNVNECGRFLAEQFSVRLGVNKKGFAVINRASLKTLLAEHKLTISGLVDPENAKKLGKFSGVDAIILGSITPLKNEIVLTVQVIATETAEVIGADTRRIEKSKDIEMLLTSTISTGSTGSTSEKPDDTSKPKLDLAKLLQIEKNSLQVGDLFIKVESLRYSEIQYYGYVTTTFVMVNTNTTSAIGVAVEQKNPVSIATNNRGDEFEAHGSFDGVKFAFGSGNDVRGDFTDIPPGKSIKVVAKYQGRLTGNGGNFAPYRLQFGIYTGREVQGRYPNLLNQNVLIDVDSTK